MENIIKILRADDELDAPGHTLSIPLGWEFEETKQAAFKLAYPGNGEAPWECRLETIEGVDIDDMSLIAVVPSSTIVVNPGEGFVDNGQKVVIKPKEKRIGTLSRLRGSLRKGSSEDKDKEKEKDKETKDKEKERKRLSFFGSVRKAKTSDIPEKDAHLPDWLRLQKRIFTRYVNQKFRSANSKTRVDDLVQDCKDGLVLLELLEIMSGKNFGDKRPKPQKVRIKQIDNCVTVLGFAKDCGITTTCSAENIVDGEEKPLMAFVYQIIIKYMRLDEDDEDSAGMDVKQALIMWLRNKLQSYDIEIDEKNICKAFHDGIAFCALLHRQRPRLIPFEELVKDQKVKNLTLALDLAEQFAGVQQYVEPDDIAKLDELGMVIYLSDWYHGLAFMELQNACARRVGKLIRMTVQHDKMKAEYDDRAKALSAWVEQTIRALDDHSFDNTLEGIKAKLASFYQYKTGEKAAKISDHMDVEALYEDLALRLVNNKRPAYNPPHGLSVEELRSKMKDLEGSENRRAEAMQKELARQVKLQKMVGRFEEDREKLVGWIKAKEGYLGGEEEVTSIASAQRHLNVLAAFSKEWENVRKTRLAGLKQLGGEIGADNYKDKGKIEAEARETEERLEGLGPRAGAKQQVLERALEQEKEKERLRLEFAASSKDLELCVGDQVEAIGNREFGALLEEVEAYGAGLGAEEERARKEVGERRARAEALWEELSKLGVREAVYTSWTPQELGAAAGRVEEALRERRGAFEEELARQRANDALCRRYADRAGELMGWLAERRAAVGDKSQGLEQKLALVREELGSAEGAGEARLKELGELDGQIAAAGLSHNRHAKTTTGEARTALAQYVGQLGKLRAVLEAEEAQRSSKGVTEEQREEMQRNFDHFDKDRSGFLDRREFRACLQSLGQNATPAAVREVLASYDKDQDGKISRDEFCDYMLKRVGDTDTHEQIIDDFVTINQREDAADLDHLNAVVNDFTFTEPMLAYLKQEMPPAQDPAALDFRTWTQAVFDR